MKTNDEDLLLVGDLQFLALPFVSLYIDRERRKLSLFVRVSEANETERRYIVTEVTPDAVCKYMSRSIRLRSLFPKGHYMFAHIQNGKIHLEKRLDYPLDDKLKKAGLFDPQFCHDHIRLKCFLHSLNNKKQGL